MGLPCWKIVYSIFLFPTSYGYDKNSAFTLPFRRKESWLKNLSTYKFMMLFCYEYE